MKIGVIGGGVVGQATARCWLEHCDEVRVYDTLKERQTHDLFETSRCDIVFVCLPERQLDSFFADCSSLGTESIARNANFVLRSTIPIGTTRRLAKEYELPNLVHSPEFLTARCAITDTQIPARNIVGDTTKNRSTYSECAGLLWKMYEKRFPGVQVMHMTAEESEAIKLATNSFFAVKVAFFNELYALCDKLNLNWKTVRAGILSDGRIAHAHTQVPGPDGQYGFGGSCLPKDLDMLIDTCLKTGSPKATMLGARLTNSVARREHG